MSDDISYQWICPVCCDDHVQDSFERCRDNLKKDNQVLKEKLDEAIKLLIDCADEGICDLGLYKRVNDFLF